MVKQFEQATCFSLTRNWGSLGRGLPQSQQRRVSIEMIFAVVRMIDHLNAVRISLGSFSLRRSTYKRAPVWQLCRKGGLWINVALRYRGRDSAVHHDLAHGLPLPGRGASYTEVQYGVPWNPDSTAASFSPLQGTDNRAHQAVVAVRFCRLNYSCARKDI